MRSTSDKFLDWSIALGWIMASGCVLVVAYAVGSFPADQAFAR